MPIMLFSEETIEKMIADKNLSSPYAIYREICFEKTSYGFSLSKYKFIGNWRKELLIKHLSDAQGAFDEWVQIYVSLSYLGGAPEIKKFISEKMVEVAKTSSDWRKLFRRSGQIRDKKCFILEKMIDSAESPDDIFFAIKNSPENSELQLKAENKVINLCKTFRDCVLSLRMCTDIRAPLPQRILAKAEKFDVSFEELCEIKRYYASRGNMGIAQLVSAKFAEVSTTIENWIKIYQNQNMSEDIRNIALKRIQGAPA